VFFPLIVLMGAGSNVTGKRSVAVCRFFGEISYPLYITHFPLIYMQIAWASKHPDAPLGTHVFIAVALFILSIAIAYACLKLYDEPAREWLKQRFLMKRR
ncbi:acyltransferase family protein, partial [Bacteroides heparinolyticus]